VKAGWLVDVGYSTGGGYIRDPGRASPHNLYTSTQALYARPDAQGLARRHRSSVLSVTAAGRAGSARPRRLLANSTCTGTGRRRQRLPALLRSAPATEANGAVLSAANVIVESVPVIMSWWIEDPSGSHQPVPQLLGTGRRWSAGRDLRDGNVVAAR